MADKAIFMDRDNTLIEDPGYISSPDQVRLLPGVSKALIELRKMGYMLIVATNQSAVARGIITEQVLEEIHEKMCSLLAHEGAYLDKIYYCPYHPAGVVPKYRKESNLRKPQPGMILRAADELDIDLDNSWMVGNSPCDITAGINAGCKTILIQPSTNPSIRKTNDPVPDEKAVNIKEVVNIIKMHQRQKTQPRIIKELPQPFEPQHELEEHELEEQEHEEQEQEEEQELENIPSTEKTSELSQPITSPQIMQPPPIQPESLKQPQIPEKLEPSEQVEQPETTQVIPKQKTEPDKIQQLLEDILRLLKTMQRESMFSEFSIAKLLAGIFQALVFFCLLISVWFWMDPTRPPASVHTMIGYALVLQLMVVAFYIMRDR